MSDSAIRFSAQVVKVQTTIDGGIRLTLDLGEAETETAKHLMDIRRAGGLLEIAAVPLENNHARRKKQRKNETSRTSDATY